jgi:hypothetical protein
MSFRDIGFILKKHGLSHGIVITEDNDKNNQSHSNNEKARGSKELYGYFSNSLL